MGRVADDLRLLDLVWSDDLLAEARRSLVEKKCLTEEVATRWVDYLPRNFPDGETDVTRAADVDIEALTDDPDDRHVCALAIGLRVPATSSLTTAVICARPSEVRELRSPRQTRSSPPPSTPTPRIPRAHRAAGRWLGVRTADQGVAGRDRAGRGGALCRQGACSARPLSPGIQEFEPTSSISGTSGGKFPKRRISAHIPAHRTGKR